MMTARKQVACLWKPYWDRETKPGYPGFWNCKTPITRDEIKKALDAGSFNLAIEDNGAHNDENRDWHVRQIATFVDLLKNGRALPPIRLDIADDSLADGCHRLYAHWYLDDSGTSFIEVTYNS